MFYTFWSVFSPEDTVSGDLRQLLCYLLQDVPDSFYTFSASDLELTIFERCPGSFQWEMIFGYYNLNTRLITVTELLSISRSSQWTELGDIYTIRSWRGFQFKFRATEFWLKLFNFKSVSDLRILVLNHTRNDRIGISHTYSVALPYSLLTAGSEQQYLHYQQ